MKLCPAPLYCLHFYFSFLVMLCFIYVIREAGTWNCFNLALSYHRSLSKLEFVMKIVQYLKYEL